MATEEVCKTCRNTNGEHSPGCPYDKDTTCQHLGEAKCPPAYHVEGIVYVCSCGDSFDVPALLEMIELADRRAGSSERMLESKFDTVFRKNRWNDERKDKLGYDRNVSFDVVWDDLINLLGGYEKARELCLTLPDERRR